MSDPDRYTSRPPVVTGPDGLPHCGWCLSEHVLCLWHKNQVRVTLDNLISANTLARAEADIRYLVVQKLRQEVDA